jgi:HSP20 family protein
MTLKDLMQLSKKDVPVRREERNPFALFRKEMDALFDNFFSGFDLQRFESSLGGFNPKVDVVENDKEIKVTAELPGIDEKEIDLSLSRGALTIRGEKQKEKEDRGKDYYRMERSFGAFSRVIPLPAEVDDENVQASFRKGVLSITLPKTVQELRETKKVPIKMD